MSPASDTDREQPCVTSPAPTGLSSQEATKRLTQYGPNEPAPIKGGAAITELLLLFFNPWLSFC